MPAAIFCRDLRKRYPSRPAPVDAVNGLDLEVHPGECFGLLGPNGAGKTTTIEILEGILPATSGHVEILGRRWAENDEALRQHLGISLQETRLAEKLTVRETLTLFRSFYQRGLLPQAAMEQVGLTEHLIGEAIGPVTGTPCEVDRFAGEGSYAFLQRIRRRGDQGQRRVGI